SLRGYLEKGLIREGFSVDTAPDARTGNQLASTHAYDIILTDIRMPELSGIWLLRTLRQTRNNALVFMITGQAGEEDKLDAYDGGADDYLVKPFQLSELVAKIRAWLKRRHDFLSSDVNATLLIVGDLRLDLLKRRAIRGGRSVRLTPMECKILEYLMRHKGKVQSQSIILGHVSDVDFDGFSNSVE